MIEVMDLRPDVPAWSGVTGDRDFWSRASGESVDTSVGDVRVYAFIRGDSPDPYQATLVGFEASRPCPDGYEMFEPDAALIGAAMPGLQDSAYDVAADLQRRALD
jgi:hypothetical protein